MAGAMKTRHKAAQKMSETLRQEILSCGLTLYRVSKDSGVSYSALYRFVMYRRPVSMETMDKLCAYFGLRLSR
jgi:plasmid maintenance system antidote protein VapI